MKSIFLLVSSLIISVILLSGCSKQTKATKPFHNLTGRYNAYYNANNRLTESFDLLNKQYQDNYNKLLHMYPYAAVADASAVQQPLDEAITKAARNIVLHRIGNWTDNSYMLMGKTEFLLKKYEKSAGTFKYIVEKYDPAAIALEEAKEKKKKKPKKSKKKKRKKKKKKKKTTKSNNSDTDEEDDEPVKYGIKHRPVWHEARLWLAKSHIELKMFDEAGYHLRQLENDLTTPYKLRPQIQAVIAYNWVVQKEFDKAIAPLEKAIETTRKKTIKNRYVYLLAQLYQEKGNSELAMENYRKVLRLRPSYEMEFNATLNMVKNAASVSGKKPINPELALKRMLRDSKNDEYKDQIYFALAQIRLKDGDTEGGIAALQQSLNYGNNPVQRAEGCLMLAQLFYDKDDYINSYAYYDSTLLAMQKTDDRYASVEIQKRRLKGVATNLAQVIYQDSMQLVGSWDRKQQESWALKAMVIDAQAAADGRSSGGSINPNSSPLPGQKGPGRWKNAAGVNAADPTSGSSRPKMPSNGGGVTVNDNALQQSKFALYNPSLKRKGAKEFEKRWGTRAWADNWRRSNKSGDEASDDENIAVEAPPKTQAEIDDYLKKKGVPQNEEEKKAVENKLAEAMFKAASHYHEDLNRKDKALALVNKVVDNHAESEYAVEALFLAYNIYYGDGNKTKAETYKKEILSKYPESNIAKVLKDPDFANAQQKKYNAINKYYDESYEMLKKGQAQAALERVRKVADVFGEDYLMKGRFAILEAMCLGGVKGEEEYIRALRVVVTSFPNTKEEKQAIAMLAVLTDRAPKINMNNKPKGSNLVPYTVDMKAKHLVIIVFENKRTRVNQYRAPITTYNTQTNPDARLSVSSILIDGSLPSITIRPFLNGSDAMKYAVQARSNPEFLKGAKGYTIYVISQQNYNLALSTQKFADYIPFHEEHYR